MLVKLLGIVDLIAGLIIIFGIKAGLPNQIIIVLGVILLAKSSLGLLKDFGSWMDILGGGILLLSIIINIPSVILIVIGLLILQKGVFSFV